MDIYPLRTDCRFHMSDDLIYEEIVEPWLRNKEYLSEYLFNEVDFKMPIKVSNEMQNSCDFTSSRDESSTDVSQSYSSTSFKRSWSYDYQGVDNHPIVRPVLKNLHKKTEKNHIWDLVKQCANKKTEFIRINENLKKSKNEQLKSRAICTLTRREHLLFHKQKYLNIKTVSISQKINQLHIDAITHLSRDLHSLLNVATVFPTIVGFLREDINIDQLTSCTEPEKKVIDLSYKLSQVHSKITSLAIEMDQISRNIPTKFDFTMPTEDENQPFFDVFIEFQNNEIKTLISKLVNFAKENDPSNFKTTLDECIQKLTASLDVGTRGSKKLVFFLVRNVFRKAIENGFVNQQNFENPPRVTTLTVGDLPVKEVMNSFSPETPIKDFVQANAFLKEAVDEIEMTSFEPSPVDVLVRTSKAIRLVQMYISDIFRLETGGAPAFVPFDYVFQVFVAVFSCANIEMLPYVVELGTAYINPRLLPNNLSFASTTISGAYEYRIKHSNGAKE